MFIQAVAAGSAPWCARALARWPRLGSAQVAPHAVAYHAACAPARGGALASPAQGAAGEAALLYAHDGRYPDALGREVAHALASGAAAAPAEGGCSVICWRGGALEASRDPCGVSALWYAVAPQGAAEGVAVASHPWLLRRLLDRPCDVHVPALAAFLLGEDADDDADFFCGLRRLRPGERLLWRLGDASVTVRARAASLAQGREPSPSAWAGALRDALRAQCARVERPFVVALSGGIDSGLVAAASLRARPGGRLRAVSMSSARWPEMDEGFAIDQWEAAAPVEVRRCCVDGFGPLEAATLLRDHADLGPQGHGGVAFLAGLARSSAAGGDDLLLTGLGGDQVFDLPDAHWLPSALFRDPAVVLGSVRARGLWPLYAAWARPWLVGPRLRRLRRALGGRYLLRRARHLAHSPWRDAQGWLAPAAADALPPPDPSLDERMGWLRGWIWEDAVRHLSLCQLAAGVSFAHPLLDPAVLDVLTRAPSALLMHPQPKALARLALAGEMPEPLRGLPKIGGFDRLMEQGLADHADTTLTALFDAPRLSALGLLRRDAFLNILRQFVAWTRRRDTRRVGYAHLWRTISAELWLQSLSPPAASPPWSPLT